MEEEFTVGDKVVLTECTPETWLWFEIYKNRSVCVVTYIFQSEENYGCCVITWRGFDKLVRFSDIRKADENE